MNTLGRAVASLQLAGGACRCGKEHLPSAWPAVLAEALVDELIARLEARAACSCACCAARWAELDTAVAAAIEARQ